MDDGRSTVLLHGIQSSRLSWWRMAQDLTDLGWRVQALDMLGHGDRYQAGVDLTLDGLARDVMEQAPGPVDLVIGHSLGAIVALTLAQLDPGYTRAIVLEDPPGLAGSINPGEVADSIERAVSAARQDPESVIAGLISKNRNWSPIDAENAVLSRVRLDVKHATGLLRDNDPWDLSALVAECPVPLHLLAATNDTALVEPDRTELMNLLPPTRVSVIESGHSIHRDRPALWLHEVLQFVGQD